MTWRPPKSLLKQMVSDHPLDHGPPVAGVCVQNKPPVNHLQRTFLIFAPWCDQGLGNQARAYCGWLTHMGHRPVVFACKPSKKSSAHAPSRMQADPTEWEGVKVHVSGAVREAVPHGELTRVAQENHVTDALMLETCHKHIFVLSAALASVGVRVYALPNIELVRRSELDNFRKLRFQRVLCNNQYTYDVLKYFKVPQEKLALFRFALWEPAPMAELHRPGQPVKFLLVGGMNAERRKQASKVIAAFTAAFRPPVTQAHLTVLCQGVDVPKFRGHPPSGVTVINKHMSNTEIARYYAESHIVIMMSRAEGIGLCLHEAMRARCAVLSMETAMFKELVLPGRTGWLIPYKVEDGTVGAKMIGNDDPVVHTYTFEPRALVDTIQLIVSGAGGSIAEMQAGSRQAHELLFSEERVQTEFAKAFSLDSSS